MGNPAWKPGVSGNPKGRPKNGMALTDILRALGEIKDVASGKKKIARKEALAEIIWRKALEGNLSIAEYIFDRLDGKPKERKEVTGPDSGLLVVIRNASGGNGSGA